MNSCRIRMTFQNTTVTKTHEDEVKKSMRHVKSTLGLRLTITVLCVQFILGSEVWAQRGHVQTRPVPSQTRDSKDQRETTVQYATHLKCSDSLQIPRSAAVDCSAATAERFGVPKSDLKPKQIPLSAFRNLCDPLETPTVQQAARNATESTRLNSGEIRLNVSEDKPPRGLRAAAAEQAAENANATNAAAATKKCSAAVQVPVFSPAPRTVYRPLVAPKSKTVYRPLVAPKPKNEDSVESGWENLLLPGDWSDIKVP